MPPTAISWRINAERVVLVGWLRALLLQIAHPLIAAGVAEHSTFRGSTRAGVGRLQQTVEAMLAIAFGTDDERERALDGIRGIHRRVNGALATRVGVFDAGTRYSAEDPALLLWVHLTLIESIVLTYEQLVAPLTAAERDRYCQESADVAVALGGARDAVPRTWDALRVTLDARYASGEITVGPAARALAAALLDPFHTALTQRTLTPIATTIAAGALPDAIRRQYGFDWSPRRARWFARIMELLRIIRRIMPKRVAWWRVARTVNPITAAHHGYSATAG
jgi:uncharacterized protein (DUF2236 family)